MFFVLFFARELFIVYFFFFQAEDGIRDSSVTGVQTCALPISASGAGGPGATFRGAIVALNAHTGRILWRSYSLPDNGGLPGGYAGATMFAPPAVDLAAGLVYGTFGQAYTEPASV